MAIALEFDYFKPGTLEEAVELKARYGGKARFLAGGTDLVNDLSDEAIEPEAVIDLKGIEELGRLELKGDTLFIGALVTFSDLIDSDLIKKRFPLLWEAAGEVASVVIRNRATVAGNICSCVPCMDSAPALVAYGASVLIRGPKGEKTIPVTEFFLGPRKTALKDNEVLVGILLPVPEKHGASYLKQKRYRGEDLAQSDVGILALEGNDYRIVFGSVGPVPIRAEKIEKVLRGKKLTDELIAEAKKLVKDEIAPIADIRSSKEYRLIMAEVMLERALKAAVARLNGKGPAYGTSLI
ncbi:MAG: xanthine dehydrogenase family protein subunit M [PVC group bacterium]